MEHVEVYEFGAFRLDVRNARLSRGGAAVALPPKTFDLLLALVGHGGALVDKDTLMREVWPDTFVEEANLSRHIWTLRKALGDGYVETVPKRGYRFAAAVRTAPAAGADVIIARRTETRIVETREETIEPHATSWPMRLKAAAAVMLVAIGAWAVARTVRDTAGASPTAVPEAQTWFARGESARAEGRFRDAATFYTHAVAADAEFALAESRLAEIFGALREPGQQRAHAVRAYQLRGRASDRERLAIDAAYYAALGDVPRQADALRLAVQDQPNDAATRLVLAGLYRQTGRYEAALEQARLASTLDPASSQVRAALARALVDLNRFDEAASTVAADAASPSEPLHALRFELAFRRGDTAAMQREIEWAGRTANDYSAAAWRAHAHDFHGQRRQARELFARSRAFLRTGGGDQSLAEAAALDASRDAIVGHCRGVEARVAEALGARTFNTLTLTALTRALCGDIPGARALTTELSRLANLDWLNGTVSVPIIRAFVEDDDALARTIEPFELGQTLWPIYLRGLVHLKTGHMPDAADAFRRILGKRGPAGLSIRYPLARLQLARTLARMGDVKGSRQTYEQFFADWKEADADLPILIDARREYAALSHRRTTNGRR
jgi:DNA-binding winged helix-turn-helix (wHTH) protein/tetratricopeptide (TPR) repeat protein